MGWPSREGKVQGGMCAGSARVASGLYRSVRVSGASVWDGVAPFGARASSGLAA